MTLLGIEIQKKSENSTLPWRNCYFPFSSHRQVSWIFINYFLLSNKCSLQSSSITRKKIWQLHKTTELVEMLSGKMNKNFKFMMTIMVCVKAIVTLIHHFWMAELLWNCIAMMLCTVDDGKKFFTLARTSSVSVCINIRFIKSNKKIVRSVANDCETFTENSL